MMEEASSLSLFSRGDLKKIIEDRKNVKIEEITTRNAMPPLSTKISFKIAVGMNSFHRLLQKIDAKRGTRTLETVYVTITKPFVKLYNSLVYPPILKLYLRDEERIKGDEGLTIYLILKKSP